MSSKLAFVLVLAMASTAGLAGCERAAEPAPAASAVKVGGPFKLVDTEGRPVTEKSLLVKPTAIFFGFTYCPEVCPTTLAEMTAALKDLGRNADKLNVVFISLDPERDTPAQMKLYLSNFDPRIQGFTGSAEAVDGAAKAYRVYHQKVPTEGGGYTVDHSSAVYLFDRRGQFVEPIGYGFPHDMVVTRLRRLIARR
jgi:protein SCO1/2